MDKELKELIIKFFPKKESERIINLINNDGYMVRNSFSTEYQLTLRAINKLRTAKELLSYKEIQNITEVKRRK